MKVDGRGGGLEILESTGFFPKKAEFPENLGKAPKLANFPKSKKALFSCFFAFLACFFATIELKTTFAFFSGLVVREFDENGRIFPFFQVFELQIYKNTKKNTLFFPCT